MGDSIDRYSQRRFALAHVRNNPLNADRNTDSIANLAVRLG
jgi:hypothetical protein